MGNPRIRRRTVTDEPYRIDPALLGRPLASCRRRLAAFLVDLILLGVLLVTAYVAFAAVGFHREDPTLFRDLRAARSARPDSARAAAMDDVGRRLLTIMMARRPELAGPEAVAALQDGDIDRFRELAGDLPREIVLVAGKSKIVEEGGESRLYLGTDVTLGGMARFYNLAFLFLLWFTVTLRLGRGRTPGKRLWRLRVVRLDGRPLSWWDAFGRAGGYSASAATALLGFLEALRHPNRQALHDKIAGTVVLRERAGG